jgi:lipoate-protein ligase A
MIVLRGIFGVYDVQIRRKKLPGTDQPSRRHAKVRHGYCLLLTNCFYSAFVSGMSESGESSRVFCAIVKQFTGLLKSQSQIFAAF